MSDRDGLDEELSHRRTMAGENRVPPAVAVVVAGVAYALLPARSCLGLDSSSRLWKPCC